LNILRESCVHAHVEIWAYCLMPNHSHLIAVPESPDGLRRAIGDAHRRYATEINRREGWCGHLWQERFRSYVMDERYTLAAARYIELNPVRAGIVPVAEDYRWSSARAHLLGRDDGVVTVAPLLALVPDWSAFLRGGDSDEVAARLRKHESTGRPVGSDAFISAMERSTGRILRPRKRGPNPQSSDESAGA
jgi:putative transposase